MKKQRECARLLSLVGFAVVAFGVVALDLSDVQGQDKVPEKTSKKANRKKAVDTQALRPIPGAGQKLDAMALAKLIDQEVNARLKEEKIPASPRSEDAEFYRRLHLDLVGSVPPAEKVVAFLDSKDPNKRAKAIDELLDDSRFGKFHAEIWTGMMLPRESNNRRLSGAPMIAWLTDEFNKNVPMNKLVYDLLTSTGEQDKNGAVTYFVANPTVDKITDNVTKMFLGVQLQCAQCHNHPFTDWKQNEYWGMAQFFMKVRLSANPQQAAKKGISPGIFESEKPAGKKNALPESAKKVNAKFLGGAEPKMSSTEPYRPVVAKWITSPENPYFARAMVNRFWHSVFGRGLVNPVDDMHENNSPTHPELLAALTEQYKKNDFDTKYLLRAILNSETYQRTSKPLDANKEDRECYSHRSVRSLLPEQLYDSLQTVVGRDSVGRKGDTPMVKKGPGGNNPRDQFLNFFRVVEEPDVTQYESGIPQALRLMNSPATNGVQQLVERSIKSSGNDPAKVIEQLYVSTLARRPTAEESRRFVAMAQQNAANARTLYGDLMWAMLNSSEFMLNH
jgi:hypothetical protein